MRITATLAAVLAGIALVGPRGRAGAQEVYRWYDRDGNVHYTQQPPPPNALRAPPPPAPVAPPSAPEPETAEPAAPSATERTPPAGPGRGARRGGGRCLVGARRRAWSHRGAGEAWERVRRGRGCAEGRSPRGAVVAPRGPTGIPAGAGPSWIRVRARHRCRAERRGR